MLRREDGHRPQRPAYHGRAVPGLIPRAGVGPAEGMVGCASRSNGTARRPAQIDGRAASAVGASTHSARRSATPIMVNRWLTAAALGPVTLYMAPDAPRSGRRFEFERKERSDPGRRLRHKGAIATPSFTARTS